MALSTRCVRPPWSPAHANEDKDKHKHKHDPAQRPPTCMLSNPAKSASPSLVKRKHVASCTRDPDNVPLVSTELPTEWFQAPW